MDMRMPVMGGMEATRRIKKLEAGRKTPVIAVSASVFEEEKEAVLAAGCDDFLGKPIREEQLFKTIARHLPVQYIYEHGPEETLPSGEAPPAERDPAFQRLVLLPKALRRELKHALAILDIQQINSILQEIEARDPELCAAMRPLADSFDYRRFQDLIVPYMETT
ncbi:MAG: response regulator [Desulfobacteraceae bacterium]|nr:response regulator [Desulfobacteraceae bacterium]